MNVINIRGQVIGEGRPKICVPIVGQTREEVFEQAEQCKAVGAELVEWRADWFADVFVQNEVLDVLKNLRQQLGDIPLLFTFRTEEEGGACAIEKNAYRSLNLEVIKSGYVDLVDVEIFLDEQIGMELIACAHANEKKIIASNHDFHGTPAKEEVIRRLCYMQELDADILKIAVMPKNQKDVLTLLEATEEMYRFHASRPIVTMAMGKLGLVSRISGEVFGSAITFGTMGKASAPGQIEVERLREMLEMFHERSKHHEIDD